MERRGRKRGDKGKAMHKKVKKRNEAKKVKFGYQGVRGRVSEEL